ncbi:MAG: glycosyltransferase [Hyphomicrobium sp.]
MKHEYAANSADATRAWLQLIESQTLLRQNEELAHSVNKFLSISDGHLTQAQLKVLLEAANSLYLHDQKSAAANSFYRLARAAGDGSVVVALRLAEYALSDGKPELALEYLEPISAELDPWGLCTLAAATGRAKSIGEALKIFDVLLTEHGQNKHFWYALGETAKHAAVDDLKAVISLIDEKQSLHDKFDLQIKLALRLPEIEGIPEISRILQQAGMAEHKIDKWLLVDCGYLFMRTNRAQEYEIVRRSMLAQYEDQSEVLECLLTGTFMSRDWREAGRLINIAQSYGLIEKNPNLLLKQFEVACYSQNVDAASRFYPAIAGVLPRPLTFDIPIYAYLAERKEWANLIDQFCQHLAGRNPDHHLISLVARGVRYTKHHLIVLAAIRHEPDWTNSEGLRSLYNIIVQDLIFCTPGADIEEQQKISLIKECIGLASSIEKRRLCQHLSISPIDIASTKAENAVFFCTNRKYMAGTLVALSSLLESCVEARNGADYYLIVDPEDEDITVAAVGPLSEHYKININIVYSSLIVREDVQLLTSYGMFTGGHSLARAAYYRIYFARYLVDQGNYKKIIYLDSDVIIQESFSELLTTDAPEVLSARLEVDRTEVRQAIAKHGLEPGRYFNSGVLVLHGRNAGCLEALDRSILAAETRSNELIFQDQCALNIGFKGAFTSLDQRFNYLLDPRGDDAAESRELASAATLHFIDRPKPWDPMYTRSAGIMWMQRWAAIAALLPTHLADQIFREAAR